MRVWQRYLHFVTHVDKEYKDLQCRLILRWLQSHKHIFCWGCQVKPEKKVNEGQKVEHDWLVGLLGIPNQSTIEWQCFRDSLV